MRNGFVRASILVITVLVATPAIATEVKQSRSGICHDASSPYYEKTRNFTPYASLDECLANGGRLVSQRVFAL
jgi:hypothetical protein